LKTRAKYDNIILVYSKIYLKQIKIILKNPKIKDKRKRRKGVVNKIKNLY